MLQTMKTKTAQQYYGSRKALAEALGVTVGAISLWGDDVPELRQYQLEVLTRGKLKASEPVAKQ